MTGYGWGGGDGKDNSCKIGKPFSYDNEFESLPVKSFLTWTFDGEFICVVPWVVCYTAVFSV